MFTGHYAPALAAHRLVPRAPLWALLLAAQAVDVGFMALGLVGVEGAQLSAEVPRLVVTAGVWTHSLPATAVWAVLCGLVAARISGQRRVGVAIAAVTASHWLLDLAVHTPDLPLGFAQEPAVGLGLWLHPPWAWALEVVALTATAAWLAAGLRGAARNRTLLLVAGLVLLQTLSEFVVAPPTTFPGLAGSALAVYLGVAIAGRAVDRAEA